VIELHGLKKSYGEVEALRGISTSIPKGEIVGLLGPNGAGKTTALKILVSYLLPSAGTARVAGYDVVAEPLAVQQRVGYLPENAPLYVEMLVQEYLRFTADMRDLPPRVATRRIVEVARECAVHDVLTRPIGQLSKGYRQRVGLAAAILHDPEILILDEPTNGLDPNQIVEVRNLIRSMAGRKTVILSTHILPEVEASCGRAVILIDGTIRADGTLAELTRSHVLVVSLAADRLAEARLVLESLPGVAAATYVGQSDRFHDFRLQMAHEGPLAEAVFETARHRNWTLRELRRDDKTLEQVFRELTEGAARVAA
jgi:ABC-2 type transport system ATP-binding protein